MQPPPRGRSPSAPSDGGAGDDDPIVARIRAWARRPTAEDTLALIEELRRNPGLRGQHVEGLARAVTQRHAGDPRILVGIGRLQLAVGKLSDAQQTLVTAGRADPNARDPYRYLGEVLLRRGDATRAERMLEKAVEIERLNPGVAAADADESSSDWLQRARTLKTVQDAQGEGAVAAEVAAQLARGGRRGTLPPRSSLRAPAPVVVESDDEPTHIGQVPENLRRLATPGFESAPVEDDNLVTNEIPAFRPTAPSAAPAVSAPALKARPTPPPLPPSRPPQALPPPPLPPSRPPPPLPGPAPRAVPARVAITEGVGADDSGRSVVDTGDFVGTDHPTIQSRDEQESVPRLRATPPRTDDASPLPGPIPTQTGALRALKAQSVTLGEPTRDERFDTKRSRTLSPGGGGGETSWEPERVLDALARAGVYEPSAAAASPASWAKGREIRHVRRRGGWVYLVLGFLVFGGVGGAIYGGREYKERSRRAAEQAVVRAESSVRKANLDALAAAEKDLGEVFELDSRSWAGARVWLQDRVLRSYVWPSENRKEGGLAAAIERAKTVGLPEPELAFARIALALSSDDTPSAAALAKTLDPGSAKEKVDAWRELTVGWVLERAGDARSADRYSHAVQLDPELIPARLALAKLAAISGDSARVETETKDFAGELTATKQDLLALAKLIESGALGKGGPAEARRPAGFGWIAPALILADTSLPLPQRKTEGARAVGLARDPGDLTRIGRLAAAAGDEGTASRAALRALEASPIFPPARALGARLALSVGRPDDAARALEGVSAESDAELAALRGWVAYERQDLAAVQTALETPAVPAAAWDRAELAPIVKPLRFALAANKRAGAPLGPKDKPALEATAALGELGPLVAFDVALAALDLALAESIAKPWGDVSQKPARALRLARLARMQGKAEEAEKLSRIAIEQSTVTPAALVERVLVLGGLGKGAEALLLLARYPLLVTDEQPWLRAWATAQAGKMGDAKKQVEALKEPDKKAPWLVRRDALLALAATNDKRAKNYAKDLFKERAGDPDVHAVAKVLGVVKD